MLTNQELNSLYRWLSVPMHGEDARARNNFVKATEATKLEIDNKRTAILESYCEKDKDGKAIIEAGNYKLIEGKEEECKKELADFLEANSPLALDVKIYKPIALVLEKNVRADMTIDEAKLYYKVIDILEAL